MGSPVLFYCYYDKGTDHRRGHFRPHRVAVIIFMLLLLVNRLLLISLFLSPQSHIALCHLLNFSSMVFVRRFGLPQLVMQWMEDSGVQPSVEMYQSILAFAQSSGREYSVIIQDRVGRSMPRMVHIPATVTKNEESSSTTTGDGVAGRLLCLPIT
ncbi:hypothetical protein Ccrd_003155 [Cynara cardunculus var. scolymus]|uniref:Uncharacterized protein n=1 Tax=Cynara cardunculus var. scolymus TaxID=59895 RepID=A0A118JWJ7_CYNCS|nr:hypothetical protein Ccrd_003155 [Cynara cardunculus var. scolymus]